LRDFNEISSDKLRIILLEISKKAKIDEKEFFKCYNNNKTEKLVNSHFQEAKSILIDSTPTFIINDKRVIGALPYSELKAIIEKELINLKNH